MRPPIRISAAVRLAPVTTDARLKPHSTGDATALRRMSNTESHMTGRTRVRMLIGLLLVTAAAGRPSLRAAPPDLAGAYEIVARHSGKCLDVTGVSLDDGAQIIQWTCNNGLNQRWTLQPTSDGYYLLVATRSGKALDVTGVSLDDGARAIQYTINGGANQ